MPESTPGKTLTVLRFIVGGGTWLAPGLMGRMFGLDADRAPELKYVGRLFGVRDAVLGVGLASTDGDSRRLWWQLGVACDVADAAAALMAMRRRDVTAGSGVLLTAFALLATGLGTAALAADDV